MMRQVKAFADINNHVRAVFRLDNNRLVTIRSLAKAGAHHKMTTAYTKSA